MNFYYAEESTPLGFHKAFYKVLCPIAIVVQSLILLATLAHLAGDSSNYDPNYLILTLFSTALGILFLSLITYGFAHRKEYAWYMVYAYSGLTVLTSIISATQYENFGSAIVTVLISSILPILIGIYYYKRKPIFVPSEFKQASTEHYSDKVTEKTKFIPTFAPSTSTKQISHDTRITFCRKCGHKLVDGASFCHKCGSKTS